MQKIMRAATIIVVVAALTVATSAVVFAQTTNEAKTKLLGFARWHEGGTSVWVVGGYDAAQKKWLSDSAARMAFYPGSKFQLFDLQEHKGEVTINRPEPEEATGGYYATGRQKLDGEGMAIAVANVAQPMPRSPREQSLTADTYQRAAASLLRAEGLNVQQAQLQQHWRVDLNGDGIEEVLLSAHSRGEMGTMPNAEKGDYSVAAIRFYDPSRPGDKVQLVPLGIEVVEQRVQFGAPLGFEILGCVDINGDDAMEIVVRNFYYEGEGIEIFTFDGHRVRSVINAGWGV